MELTISNEDHSHFLSYSSFFVEFPKFNTFREFDCIDAAYLCGLTVNNLSSRVVVLNTFNYESVFEYSQPGIV